MNSGRITEKSTEVHDDERSKAKGGFEWNLFFSTGGSGLFRKYKHPPWQLSVFPIHMNGD